jgi:hypothetical protein
MKKESSYFIICIFLLLCLLQLYLFLDRANFFSGKTGAVFTVVSSYYVLTLIAINIFSIFIFLDFIKQTNADIEFFQLAMFPSVFISLLSFLLEIVPYFYYLSNPEASFGNVAIPESMDDVFLLILISRFFVITGIVLGRKKEFFLLKYDNLATLRDLEVNSFKKIITSKIPFFVILSSGIFVGLARIGFNFDYRRGTTELLIIGDNILSITSIFIVLFTAIFYYQKSSSWLIVIASSLPSILTSSRAGLMTFVIYILASSFSGKKYPKSLFFIMPPLILITSFIGLAMRENNNPYALLSTTSDEFLNTLIMSNNNLGVLSNSLYFYNSNNVDFLTSLYRTALSVIPIPSFIYLDSSISVAVLRGFTNVGIPMPAFGDIYFNSGWLGLVLFSCLIGWLCGRLEAKLVFYKQIINIYCWQHILILMGFLWFFLYSYHNTFRASSRILIYVWAFVLFTYKFFSKNTNSQHSM